MIFRTGGFGCAIASYFDFRGLLSLRMGIGGDEDAAIGSLNATMKMTQEKFRGVFCDCDEIRGDERCVYLLGRGCRRSAGD